MVDIQKVFTDKPIKNGGIVVTTNGLNTDKSSVAVLVSEVINTPSGASYTGTWICPSNIGRIFVECWGQGGRGGNMIGSGTAAAGGGGGGAYAASYIDVVPSASYNFVVGNAQSDMSEGTWFSGRYILYAQPGASGQLAEAYSGVSVAGGNGGSASGCFGEIRIGGDIGQSGSTVWSFPSFMYLGQESGYYGGGGGNSANAHGVYGLGADRNLVPATGNGTVGGIPGGGGSGGKRPTTAVAYGGYGGAGRIIINYYVANPSTFAAISGIENLYTERFDDTTYV